MDLQLNLGTYITTNNSSHFINLLLGNKGNQVQTSSLISLYCGMNEWLQKSAVDILQTCVNDVQKPVLTSL
jgi:hypothetical protein